MKITLMFKYKIERDIRRVNEIKDLLKCKLRIIREEVEYKFIEDITNNKHEIQTKGN